MTVANANDAFPKLPMFNLGVPTVSSMDKRTHSSCKSFGFRETYKRKVTGESRSGVPGADEKATQVSN